MKAKSVPKKPRKPNYQYQKPLEPEWKRQKLSTENQVKIATDVNENESPNMNHVNENSQDSVINVDKDDSPPAPLTSLPNSIIPPTGSSAFYPYVDPLHFFIDLRVSAGQVYDRKKEAYLQQALKNNNILLDSNTWNNPIIGKNRVGSAFKVPGSENNNNFSAINLIANNETSPKFYQKRSSIDGTESDKNDEDVEVFEVEMKQDMKIEKN